MSPCMVGYLPGGLSAATTSPRTAAAPCLHTAPFAWIRATFEGITIAKIIVYTQFVSKIDIGV